MRWRFLIWFFLGIIYNPCVSYTQDNPLEFQDLKLGMSYSQVLNVLKYHKVFLKTENPEFYSISIPIYDLLDIYDPANNFIDKNRMRIYYDNEVFFDLRNLNIENKTYHFFYKDPYYFMSFNSIVSYEVAYASRINNLLYSLWVKFFNNKLYALEYKSTLTPLELNRVKNNYFRRYGRILTPGVQVVEKDNVTSIITLDRETITITRIDQNLRDEIFAYLDNKTADLLKEMDTYIHKIIKDTQNPKLLILQDKKRKLQESLSNKYRFLDTL